MAELESLVELLAWVRANAPVTAERLGSGATVSAIAAAESENGVPWSPELRSLYATINGSGDDLLPRMSLWTLDEARDRHVRLVEAWAEDGSPREPAGISDSPYSAAFFPFAGNEDDDLVVDLRDGEQRGRIMQASVEEPVIEIDGGASLREYFHDVHQALMDVSAMRSGEPATPVVVDGRIRWT